MTSEPENTSTSTNPVDSQMPPGFGPEALQALSARNQKLESENALLLWQMVDIRLLMEQDRESRERDKASLDLLRTQMAQQNIRCKIKVSSKSRTPDLESENSMHHPFHHRAI